MSKLKISEEFARLAMGTRLIGRNRDIGVKLVETSGQTEEGKKSVPDDSSVFRTNRSD